MAHGTKNILEDWIKLTEIKQAPGEDFKIKQDSVERHCTEDLLTDHGGDLSMQTNVNLEKVSNYCIWIIIKNKVIPS